VTQQFNTSTSMGRLTLNVLLSFAQFEREVTGERIRDKIAASKQKGLWMGGVTPLGYDVQDRALVVNRHTLIRNITIGRTELRLRFSRAAIATILLSGVPELNPLAPGTDSDTYGGECTHAAQALWD
jgi:site-specific DNA recombinase